MSAAEIELYRSRGRNEEYLGSFNVQPGHTEIDDFLMPQGVLFMASVSKPEVTVLVKGKGIRITKYIRSNEGDDTYDDQGEEVANTQDPILVDPGFEYCLHKKVGRRNWKELWVWIDNDLNDSDFWEDIPDPTLSEPLVI
jgi:hypothetical protein